MEAASFLSWFFPLRDLADAADLMEAGARVPVRTPNRARRMLDYLVKKARSIVTTAGGLNDFQINLLLERLGGRPDAAARFEAVADSIPPGEGQVVVTERTTCVVCSKGVLVMPVGHHGRQYFSNPQLFSQDGPVAGCTLLWKACSSCAAKHYYSYAVGGAELPAGVVQPYPDWSEARFCHITEHLVFETKLLLRYRDQCLHSHSSALA